MSQSPLYVISPYKLMFLLSELPTEFTKPLADVTVTEKETVCLECEVSKANKPGKWFKNGQEIKQDDNVKFVTYDKIHRLIIKSAVLDDEAEYTVEVDGQTSKSQLYVEGKCTSLHYQPIIVHSSSINPQSYN